MSPAVSTLYNNTSRSSLIFRATTELLELQFRIGKVQRLFDFEKVGGALTRKGKQTQHVQIEAYVSRQESKWKNKKTLSKHTYPRLSWSTPLCINSFVHTHIHYIIGFNKETLGWTTREAMKLFAFCTHRPWDLSSFARIASHHHHKTSQS